MRGLVAVGPMLLCPMLLCLAACHGQIIQVTTTPPDAACVARRDNRPPTPDLEQVAAEVPSTPGTVLVQRGQDPLVINCAKAGYRSAAVAVPSTAPAGAPVHLDLQPLGR